MKRSILISLVLASFGCSTSSKQVTTNKVEPAPVTDTIQFANQQPLNLLDLPQSQDGEIILSEGYYEADFKSYCLQPGTPGPSAHDAYTQAVLSGNRHEIVESILRNSLSRPDLDQRSIQLLLWSTVSGSDYNKLSPSVKHTARELLTSKEIFALQGGMVGVMKTIAARFPESGSNTVFNNMRNLFELGTSSYEAYEQIAVLSQPSVRHTANYNKDQWHKQDGGYYLRYFPSSYQKTKVQIYVPAGTLDTAGKRNGSYLLFDPVMTMAIPANSNAQRLGIGAPVADVIRKIIIIQKSQTPKPAPKKPQPPVNNPKGIVLN